MRGIGLPKLKKVTNIELHKTPLVFHKQKHEGKEIRAFKINGVRESHQGMDPKTLDSMPMTVTLVDPWVFENT
jgi:hypothetical protein